MPGDSCAVWGPWTPKTCALGCYYHCRHYRTYLKGFGSHWNGCENVLTVGGYLQMSARIPAKSRHLRRSFWACPSISSEWQWHLHRVDGCFRLTGKRLMEDIFQLGSSTAPHSKRLPMKPSIVPSVGQLICAKCLPENGDALPHVALLIDDFRLHFVDVDQFCEACERGVSTMYLELLLSRAAPDWKQILQAAAKGGHLHVFQWLIAKRSDGRGPWKCDLTSVFHKIAEHGHLELLKWLCSQLDVDMANIVMDEAAGNGHLDMVKWLYGKGVGNYSTFAIERAAQNGQLEVVQWLHKHLPKTCLSITGSIEAREINEKGKLPASMRGLQCFGALNGAASGDHLEVVKWLHQNCKVGSTTAAMWAAGNGHLDMVQWLDENLSDQFDEGAMDKAAEEGHMDVLQWLHVHRSEGCTARAMEGAAWSGHLEILKWLHVNRQEVWTTRIMEYAAAKGQLPVVQWLYENRPETRTVEAIDWAAHNGHIDTVKWLNKHGDDVYSDRASECAALRGDLEMVCWLEENTTQQSSGWGLGEAAKRGYLDVVLVVFENRYGIGRSLGHSERYVMRECFTRTLDQLRKSGYSFTLASGYDDTTCGLLKTLDRYHHDGYRMCVCTMLQLALETGYIVLVRRFFETRTDRELKKYVEVAGKFREVELLRWLVENGARLTIDTARTFMDRRPAEMAWWLCETDRVDLVCTTLPRSPSEWLLWLLVNTEFLQKSSRDAIRKAVQTAPNNIREWLVSTITDSKVRGWCFS